MMRVAGLWRGILFVLLLFAGCVTTQDRYERAQDYAAEGRYVEAARSYVRVLEAEPDWSEARSGLETVGQQAVDSLLTVAELQAAEAHYEDAVATLDAVDDLRADTERVGVTLAVPDDYADYRADLVRKAADALVEDGAAAEEVGDWAEAADAYEQARAYVTSGERRARLDEAQARVLLRWSEEELAQDRYRAAYERAGAIAEFVGSEHLLRREADALREAALDAGTRVVAFLPLGRTGEAAAALPERFVSDLTNALQFDHWAEPPAFIAPADPLATRRQFRRTEGRAGVTRREAAGIGRVLGADLVLASKVIDYEETRTVIREREREARMRVRGATGQGPQWRDTTYVEQTIRMDVEAAVEWRLVDARSGRIVDRGTAPEQTRGELQQGLFAGEDRWLDLSDSERRLFDLEALRQDEQAIDNQLIDQLAARLAETAFTRMLHRID